MDLHPKHDRNSQAYIPPRFWAVSRDQILYFQSVVKKGVDEGMITWNSAHHDEGHTEADFKNERYGPSMYEVNEQCIMPITRQEGNGVSWALWQNENGLCCDLFVTHAWSEGVYEFVDKLLQQWPRAANAAWICFLAIPQNTNPALLVSTKHVADTPFHQALSASRYMVGSRIISAASTQGYGVFTKRSLPSAWWARKRWTSRFRGSLDPGPSVERWALPSFF